MGEVVLDLPEELGALMRRHASVDWSGIAARAIGERLAELELLDAIAEESRLSEEDAVALGRKVRRGMWERFYKGLV